MKLWTCPLRTLSRGLLFAALGVVGYFWLFHSYFSPLRRHPDLGGGHLVSEARAGGADSGPAREGDADGDGVEDASDVAENARALLGIGYDPLQGKLNNLGGRLGLLVCVDVPRIAYAGAGISLETLLRDDFAAHPERYDTDGGKNTPASPYFCRRVRNLYAYCHGNGELIKRCRTPRVGDVLFGGRVHVLLVTAVHRDGTYDEIEAAPQEVFVVEHKGKRWVPRDVGRILSAKRGSDLPGD